MSSGVEGLFDLAPARLSPDDQVDIMMPWGEVWHCTVVRLKQEKGWPVADVHRLGPWIPEDVFSVDVARCRLVVRQPALEGL